MRCAFLLDITIWTSMFRKISPHENDFCCRFSSEGS
jgi:hypothetical protein